MEDDFDRRTYFCEKMMDMLDKNMILYENVMSSDQYLSVTFYSFTSLLLNLVLKLQIPPIQGI